MIPKTPTAGTISATEAIRRVGSPSKLAALISDLTPGFPISQSAIAQWRYKDAVPDGRIEVVAKILGVPESDLRPDRKVIRGRLVCVRPKSGVAA